MGYYFTNRLTILAPREKVDEIFKAINKTNESIDFRDLLIKCGYDTNECPPYMYFMHLEKEPKSYGNTIYFITKYNIDYATIGHIVQEVSKVFPNVVFLYSYCGEEISVYVEESAIVNGFYIYRNMYTSDSLVAYIKALDIKQYFMSDYGEISYDNNILNFQFEEDIKPVNKLQVIKFINK